MPPELLTIAARLALIQLPEGAHGDAIFSSITVIIASICVFLFKGYWTKQFSAINARIGGVIGEVAGLRVEMAAMDGRIKSIPADTALQISESYEKGSVAARLAFVAKDACNQRKEDVNRRLGDIEGVAREAAQHAERANYKIEGLEAHQHGGD